MKYHTSSHLCMYLSSRDIRSKRSKLSILASRRILSALDAFNKDGEILEDPLVAIRVK